MAKIAKIVVTMKKAFIGNHFMNNRIDKKELTKRISTKINEDQKQVEKIVDATFEEIYQALKCEESVSIRNFGTFYVKQKSTGCVFKFNPAQRLRKLFGWSSTYKEPL